MQNDFLVTSVPVTPKTSRIGVLTWPYLIELISKALKIEPVFSINAFHSYLESGDAEIKKYLDFLQGNGVNADDVYIDKNHLPEIQKLVQYMFSQNLIKIENKIIYRCSCGRVDVLNLENDIQYDTAKLYSIKDKMAYCNFCNTECKPYSEKVLVMPVDISKCQEVQIVPNLYESYFNNLYKKFSNQSFLISKNRETGIKVNLDGQDFNIDVDFSWMLFTALLPDKNKIIIAGNRHILKMMKIHYVNSILKQKPVIFLATSYNMKNLDFDETKAFFEIEDANYKKLFLLYHQSWNNHTNSRIWDKSIYKFLKKQTVEKRERLYSAIMNTDIKITKNMQEKMLLLVKNINLSKNYKQIQNIKE